MGPIYQHVVSTVRYLLDKAEMMWPLINTDRGYYLGVSNIHIPLSDLPI
jgi:hypothetical protein